MINDQRTSRPIPTLLLLMNYITVFKDKISNFVLNFSEPCNLLLGNDNAFHFFSGILSS